jgi:hypothetical protein
MCLFLLYIERLPSYQPFLSFSINKSFKTYLGQMLPPGGKNWQLISPHYGDGQWMIMMITTGVDSIKIPDLFW